MTVVVFIIVLSILVIVHEFGHFITAKRNGVKVETFSIGFGPKVIGIKHGDTEYKISAIPLGGYVKMAGENYVDNPTGASWEFLSRPVWQRFKIVTSGPLLNYILGFIIFSLVFMIGIPVSQNTNRIGSLIRGYPAIENGLKTGDTIVSVDGKKTPTWEELVKSIHKKTDGSITLRIKRETKTFDVNLTPRVEKKMVIGDGKKVALIGIRPEYEVKRYSFFKSISLGAEKLITLTIVSFKAIWWMITGKLSLREMTGPVGIFMVTGEMAKLGFVYLLDFMGLISASLAIFNMLPIPVLDGGHVVFLVIEKIRGRPLNYKTQEKAAQVGLIILLTLMIFILYSDFVKFGLFERILTSFRR